VMPHTDSRKARRRELRHAEGFKSSRVGKGTRHGLGANACPGPKRPSRLKRFSTLFPERPLGSLVEASGTKMALIATLVEHLHIAVALAFTWLLWKLVLTPLWYVVLYRRQGLRGTPFHPVTGDDSDVCTS